MPYTFVALGKILHNLFPTLKLKRIYHPVKHFTVSTGITQLTTAEKEHDNSFQDVVTTASPYGFIDINENPNEHILVQFTGDTCDGNRVTKEISINHDTWFIHIAGKLANFGDVTDLPDDSIPLSRASQQHVFHTVSNTRICHGVPQKNAKGNDKQKIQVWVVNAEKKYFVKSKSCKGYIKLSSKQTMCLSCSQLAKEMLMENCQPKQVCDLVYFGDHNYCVPVKKIDRSELLWGLHQKK
jgi:hypothetical protein